ncbi:DNA integrity scanning protein DisA [Candidatus Pacearchaeota archaeon CG10_big_fil_rev_8_21_14_0_10_34_12]|nr:MAG: DNA integrity scanning protein DisA [Candidatus Pacearchaeota archaeon CG10_big_fil_rev_8_21_14_0_10_34_12]
MTGKKESVKQEITVEEKNSPNEVNEEKDFLDVLRIFSPGTAIRTALDDILRAGMGALIVVEKEGIEKIIEGGFRINSKFSAQKLVELAKMDGAIILSDDFKKIMHSNILLTPSSKFQTKETGTRHKAAERTAKQLGTIVMAVSERKRKITLYYKDESYFLEETSEVLRRAAETLQILEKQTDMFNDLLSHLNILEITNLTTMSDVCSVLQTLEMVRRISEIVKRYLIELGKEGTIVSMRLKELTKNMTKERDNILKDYFQNKYVETDEILKGISFDFLLETSNILRLVFGELHDGSISPRGTRILSKMSMLEKDRDMLIETFGTIDKIFNADSEELKNVFKNENLVGSFLSEMRGLKEKIMMGKRI